jgi:hypothetical protein
MFHLVAPAYEVEGVVPHAQAPMQTLAAWKIMKQEAQSERQEGTQAGLSLAGRLTKQNGRSKGLNLLHGIPH